MSPSLHCHYSLKYWISIVRVNFYFSELTDFLFFSAATFWFKVMFVFLVHIFFQCSSFVTWYIRVILKIHLQKQISLALILFHIFKEIVHHKLSYRRIDIASNSNILFLSYFKKYYYTIMLIFLNERKLRYCFGSRCHIFHSLLLPYPNSWIAAPFSFRCF